MGDFLILIGIFGIIALFGGGGAYWIWLKTRTPKLTWEAEIYTLSDGIRSSVKDKKGNIISNLELRDLKFFMHDVVEKINVAEEGEIYRLQKLRKTISAVTNDYVEILGQNKRVIVLLQDNSCTLLKRGYDESIGRVVFQPMSYDRMSMIRSEMAIREDRLEGTKNILERILPWVVTGMLIFGMVGIAWVQVQGSLKMTELNLEGQTLISNALDELGQRMYNSSLTEAITEIPLGRQPLPIE